MRTLKRTLLGLSLLCVATLAGAAPRPPPQGLQWAPCGKTWPGAECATFQVPLDHARPDGPTTPIALARIPAADQANRIGSVFLNPGGPGVSGVDLALGPFGPRLAALLGGRLDVVGFDPRGVGASAAIQCYAANGDYWKFFAATPESFPYTPERQRPFYDANAAYAAACNLEGQPLVAHMSTADVARDLDLLREAVGDERLTYYGASYGSFLGNVYANLFPDRVRALAVDGVIEPDLWVSGWHITLDRTATAVAFAEFLRLCDEAWALDPTFCAFGGPEGAGARWEALLASLRAAPLQLDANTAYTYDQLVSAGRKAVYAPETWAGPSGFAALFDGLADAALGEAGAAARALAARDALRGRLEPSASTRGSYVDPFDATAAVLCADTEYPEPLLAWVLVDAYAAAGSPFGPWWWWGNVPCARWPVDADRFMGPFTARTSGPVLVVGSLFDGPTDYQGALATARNLPNSRLLTYAGWGHASFGRSDCVTAHVAAFLRDGTLPREGTVCPANPSPFLPAATLRAAAVPAEATWPLFALPRPERPGR